MTASAILCLQLFAPRLFLVSGLSSGLIAARDLPIIWPCRTASPLPASEHRERQNEGKSETSMRFQFPAKLQFLALQSHPCRPPPLWVAAGRRIIPVKWE